MYPLLTTVSMQIANPPSPPIQFLVVSSSTDGDAPKLLFTWLDVQQADLQLIWRFTKTEREREEERERERERREVCNKEQAAICRLIYRRPEVGKIVIFIPFFYFFLSLLLYYIFLHFRSFQNLFGSHRFPRRRPGEAMG